MINWKAWVLPKMPVSVRRNMMEKRKIGHGAGWPPCVYGQELCILSPCQMKQNTIYTPTIVNSMDKIAQSCGT